MAQHNAFRSSSMIQFSSDYCLGYIIKNSNQVVYVRRLWRNIVCVCEMLVKKDFSINVLGKNRIHSIKIGMVGIDSQINLSNDIADL